MLSLYCQRKTLKKQLMTLTTTYKKFVLTDDEREAAFEARLAKLALAKERMDARVLEDEELGRFNADTLADFNARLNDWLLLNEGRHLLNATEKKAYRETVSGDFEARLPADLVPNVALHEIPIESEFED